MCGWCLDGGIPTGDGPGIRRWEKGGKTGAARPDRATTHGAISSGRFINSVQLYSLTCRKAFSPPENSADGPEPPTVASEVSWVLSCETAETTLSRFSATSRKKQSEMGKLQKPLLMGLLEVMSRPKCTRLLNVRTPPDDLSLPHLSLWL